MASLDRRFNDRGGKPRRRPVLAMLGVDCHLEKSNAHLIRRLLPPVHGDRRGVGIGRVRGRVVKAGFHLDPCPLGKRDRRGEVVGSLPVEIPGINPDQSHGGPIGAAGLQLEIFAEPVHMRRHGNKMRIFIDGLGTLDLMIRLPCGDQEVRSSEDKPREGGEPSPAHLLVDRGLGEVETDRGIVRLRLAAPMVVNLKQDVGAGRQ